MTTTLIETYNLVEEFLRLRKEGRTYQSIQEKWRRDRPDLQQIPSLSSMCRFEQSYVDPIIDNKYERLHYSIGNAEFLKRTNEFLMALPHLKNGIDLNSRIREYRVEVNKFLSAYAEKQKIVELIIQEWSNEVMDDLCDGCKSKSYEKACEILDRIIEIQD